MLLQGQSLPSVKVICGGERFGVFLLHISTIWLLAVLDACTICSSTVPRHRRIGFFEGLLSYALFAQH